ncbi:MAG: cation:proton antiporter [Myxococcales bacterium]|nr:cation:proton antiporter [Myxococcales bacterium]
MHHGTEFAVVIITSVALAIGAGTRALAARLKFPYTIAMLSIGLAVGIALRQPFFGLEDVMAAFSDPHYHPHPSEYLIFAMGSARTISPDLIMFVFLPALIFESAFAIDLHTFKKTVGPAIVYAAPALLLATGLTGGVLFALLGPFGWDWQRAYAEQAAAGGVNVAHGALLLAFVFGALISATDPVAVVALLRELGVSKKMSHLIEGESLLNDGTAIVVFGVLLELAIGQRFHGGGATLAHFVMVVVGGLLVGLVLAGLLGWWLGRVFNDPMVEITLTIVLGYAAMFVAEGLLHVSGVMALVAAGLWLGGPARTRISPEIGHFLHHFWELMAYLANTLIFFLVGAVIGTQVEGASLSDLGLIVTLYIAVMVIRFGVVFLFRPLANLVGDHISATDGVVVAWGGLRGAVSMSLVLVIAANTDIPEPIRDQVLILGAGVVFMTIAVNGMTMAPLLSRLGYDKAPLTEQLAALSARTAVLDHVLHTIDHVRTSRELRTVSWGDVELDVRRRRTTLKREIDALQTSLAALPVTERQKGYWLQMLNVERLAYWDAFASGTLGSGAVKVLDHEINLQCDRVVLGRLEAPDRRAPMPGGIRALVTRLLRRRAGLRGFYASFEFDNLMLQYDLARAESSAAKKVLASLPAIADVSPEVATEIRETYTRYMRTAKERLEEMRVNLPETSQAIETRLAQRIALNFEREQYEHLAHRGAIDEGLAVTLKAEVEEKMVRLAMSPTTGALPQAAALLADIPLLEPLDDDSRAHLAASADMVVVPPGEYLFRQGDHGDAMFAISRGAAEILIDSPAGEQLVDVLGGGDILGEMALLTGERRTASIRAATSVTLVRLGRAAFDGLMEGNQELSDKVWDGFAQRRFDNHLRTLSAFRHLNRAERVGWICGRPHLQLREGAMEEATADTAWLFVLTGRVRTVGHEADHVAPALVRIDGNRALSCRSNARVVLLKARTTDPAHGTHT